MLNFLLLFACMLAGVVLRRLGLLPEGTPAALNRFIVRVPLPAVVLLNGHRIHVEARTLVPGLMPWVFFVLAAVLFVFLGKRLGWSKGILGAVILTCGLGNTSFVGYPMVSALLGAQALPVAVIIDQMGSFLTLSTLGITVGSLFSSRPVGPAEILRRIAIFPPFVALLAGITLRPVGYPGWLEHGLELLGHLIAPLALVAVGFQVRFSGDRLRIYRAPLVLGLGYKLVLGPALMAALFWKGFGLEGEAFQVTVIEAAMAPMLTGAVIASEFGLAPELAALVLGVGTPLSFVTVPLIRSLI